MKIYFDKLEDTVESGVIWEKRRVRFVATRPVIVQSSEIMRIPLNVALGIEEDCVLIVGTSSELYNKVATLFPAYLILDTSVKEKPLELTVRNNGKNPLHIMAGDVLAIGYVQSTTSIEPEPFSAPFKKPKKIVKSRPSKKNADVEFEVN